MSFLLIAFALVAQKRTDPIAALPGKLKGLRIESPSFKRKVDRYLKGPNSDFHWEDAHGPTPIRIGWYQEFGSESDPHIWETVAFWNGKGHIEVQVLDSIDMTGDKTILFGDTYREGSRMVRCGDATYGGNWGMPGVLVYRLVGNRWSLAVSETDAGLEAGTHFLSRKGKIDPSTVIAMSNEYPDHLGQPHAGPLLLYQATWTIAGVAVHKGPRLLVATALSELNRLAGFAQSGKRKPFDEAVPAKFRPQMWKLLKNQISVICPHSDEYSECDTLTVWSGDPAMQNGTTITMHFAKAQTGNWRLESVKRTKRES